MDKQSTDTDLHPSSFNLAWRELLEHLEEPPSPPVTTTDAVLMDTFHLLNTEKMNDV